MPGSNEKPPHHGLMQGRKCLTRYHPGLRAFPRKTRLHSADIGAARRRLNALAPACSGAMFPSPPAAAFHLPRLSLDGPCRVLSPSSHVLLILRFSFPVVKRKKRSYTKRGPPGPLFATRWLMPRGFPPRAFPPPGSPPPGFRSGFPRLHPPHFPIRSGSLRPRRPRWPPCPPGRPAWRRNSTA